MDHPPSSSPGSATNDDKWFTWAAAAAAVFVLSIPSLLAAGVYFLVGGSLKRRDWLFLACAGSVATVVLGSEEIPRYWKWLLALVGAGDGSRTDVPVLLLVSSTVALSGLIGLVAGTRVASTAMAKMPFASKTSILDGGPAVMPSEHDLVKLTSVDPDRVMPSTVAETSRGKGFAMGLGKDGKPVYITEQEIGMHMMAFGGTGSGKTVSLQVIAGGLLDLGWSGLVLDLKEDTSPGGLRDWFKDYALHHALPYQELALSNPNPDFWFNPLAGLGVDEARDTILSLSQFDDQYYKSVQIKVLGQTLKLMYWAHEIDPVQYPTPTMYDLANLLAAPSVPAATKKMRAVVCSNLEGVTDEDFHCLSRPDQTESTQSKSWGAKLGGLYETSAGRTVLRKSDGRGLIDVTQAGITYIGLDSTSKLDLSKVISAAVLQRITVEAAQRTTGQSGQSGPPRRKFLMVDEASVVDRNILHALLSKARSAGVSVILATQGPKDWVDKNGDDFAKLSNNTNVVLVMNQGEPESAEMLADFLGKADVMQANLRYQDGGLVDSGSIREMRDHIVSPDVLRQLQIGQGVVRVGKPLSTVSFVKVIPRDPGRVSSLADASSSRRKAPGIVRPPSS